MFAEMLRHGKLFTLASHAPPLNVGLISSQSFQFRLHLVPLMDDGNCVKL